MLLIRAQLHKAIDDIVEIYVKTQRQIEYWASKRLVKYQLEHTAQIEKLIGQFRDVLTAYQLDEVELALLALQEQLEDLRQNAGVLEGRLQAAITSRDPISLDFKATQIQLADSATQSTLVRVEANNWHRQTEELQRVILELKAKQSVRTPRKQKVD